MLSFHSLKSKIDYPFFFWFVSKRQSDGASFAGQLGPVDVAAGHDSLVAFEGFPAVHHSPAMKTNFWVDTI